MTETVTATTPLIPTVSYKHFAPAGDLISCLPGMRQMYRATGKKAVIHQRLNMPGFYYDGAVHSTFSEDGSAVTMSNKMWEMLVPLLKAQDYIHSCEEWQGQQSEVNLDLLREGNFLPMPHGSLYHWQQLFYPQMATDYSERFLNTSGNFSVKIMKFGKHTDDIVYSGNCTNILRDKVIINRTQRYLNHHITYYFLKEFERHLVFAGTEKEYDVFCSQFGLQIPLLVVNNFLELAQAISRCKFFIGNQSMCYHIAEGTKKKRLLEVCPTIANTWPHGKHGYPFTQQVSLEWYFKKFLSE